MSESAVESEIIDSIPLNKIQSAVDMDRVIASEYPIQKIEINTNNTLIITNSQGWEENVDMNNVFDIERGQRISKDPPGTFFFVYVSSLSSRRLVIQCQSKQEQELVWRFILKHLRNTVYARS